MLRVVAELESPRLSEHHIVVDCDED